jgi:shikimate dehydrogenase
MRLLREECVQSIVPSAISVDRPATPSPRPVLVGLIGSGIQLSRSPAMHEAEGRAQGLAFIYRLLDTDMMGGTPPSLEELLRFAELFGFSGFNVTFPYKQAILPLLDELSPAAREIGSVNTVVLKDGRRFGHPTDLWGFRESFRRGMDGAPRSEALLLGAGGAGVAVAHALLESDVAKLWLFDTQPERAAELAERLTWRFGPDRASATKDLAEAAACADGLVNATPVGMAKLPGMPIPAALIRPGMWIADIVYFPLETELLREARGKGCRTLAGDGMALFQAVRAFELFTGITPDTDRMRAAFSAFDDEEDNQKCKTEENP